MARAVAAVENFTNPFAFEGKGFQLIPTGEVSDKEELYFLVPNQKETDSRGVLFSRQEHRYKNIHVKSPDTNVVFILLNFASQCDCVTLLFGTFGTGKGNNKCLEDVSDLARGFTQPFSSAHMALHACTDCDSTNAYKG